MYINHNKRHIYCDVLHSILCTVYKFNIPYTHGPMCIIVLRFIEKLELFLFAERITFLFINLSKVNCRVFFPDTRKLFKECLKRKNSNAKQK